MKIRFDAKQEFQLQALEATAGLFDGMAPGEGSLPEVLAGSTVPAVANRCDLSEAHLLSNLQSVQQANDLEPDPALDLISETVDLAAGSRDVQFPNFSIEMETGTGKTYVYLRSIFELHHRIGFRKFIIVVPSVAIREGVLKSIDLMRPHFAALYGNAPFRATTYDSANLAQIRQFALSDAIEVLVMTIDSFNKASNVIRQTTDRLQGDTPLHLIQATRPVLILDEPQNMESDLSVQALASLNPLLTLRYSATHRNPYNLIYRLTPFEAYRQGLVKRIEVASVIREDALAQPFIRVEEIAADSQKRIYAKLAAHKLMKGGAIREKSMRVRGGDSLEDKTGRGEYAEYTVDEISLGGGYVTFSNGIELAIGEEQGGDKEEIFRAQIAYTIEEHARKQRRLAPLGLKVLSLFFIDRVDNYAPAGGVLRRIFSEEFERLRDRLEAWADVDAEAVQAAYFAEKRRRGGHAELIDSVTGATKEDEATYDLIMRDKERLLSMDERTAFIFSHSALREGWDNPNVFQICTLNQTASEVKKRQEVGRGMRLPVDQDGERFTDASQTVLTVVANEAYDQYVRGLQTEIEQEYGEGGTPPPPPPARSRKAATLRKQYMLKPEFKGLWDQIRRKTRYRVSIDTDNLLDGVMPEINEISVGTPRVAITKAEIEVGEVGGADTFTALQMSAAKTVSSLHGRFPLPNLVDLMDHLMINTSPPMRLTRRTLLEVFRRTTNQEAGLANPQDFASAAVKLLKRRLRDVLVDGVVYSENGEWFDQSQFEPEIDSWEEYLVPADHALYDHVIVDSRIERRFVEGLEKRDDVKLYVKLPQWFTVPTPVGDYNPDWAIVIEERDEFGAAEDGKELLYLVRETKDVDRIEALRPDERRKVECGRRHFTGALGIDFDVVKDAHTLP